MKNIRIAAFSVLVLVCLTTMFVRIPLPSRGYFNVGDVAVVFGGLLLGFMSPRKGVFWALGAAGLGSALADILGGFAIFAPLTFAAKGIEGTLAAWAASRQGATKILFLAVGGVMMVTIYFVGETLMPNIGLQGAIPEIFPNLVQAVGGGLGGAFAVKAMQKTGFLHAVE